MKIFLSYNRGDSGDLADQIYLSSLSKSNDIFRDINSIEAGDVWSKTIENNISICDILIVILTPGALESSEVEKEVLLAKKHNKKIMPCLFRYVDKDQIKWELGTFEGVEFADKYELLRNLQVKLNPRKNPSEELSYDLKSNDSPKKVKVAKPVKVEEIKPKHISQAKPKSGVRKTTIRTKPKPAKRGSISDITKTNRIKSDEIPIIIDKKALRYLRLYALSPLNKNTKSHWYQKLLTLDREDKTAVYETKYCPCKEEFTQTRL